MTAALIALVALLLVAAGVIVMLNGTRRELQRRLQVESVYRSAWEDRARERGASSYLDVAVKP